VLDANGKTVNVLYPPQTAASVQQAIAAVTGAAQ